MSTLWLAAVGLPAMLASFSATARMGPTPVLVMPFAFADSDESDPTEADAAHVDLMLKELRIAIDQKGVYRTIAPDPMLADFVSGDAECVLRRARDLGATYVLAGAVQNIGAEAVQRLARTVRRLRRAAAVLLAVDVLRRQRRILAPRGDVPERGNLGVRAAAAALTSSSILFGQRNGRRPLASREFGLFRGFAKTRGGSHGS